jgi:hypothetical protein
METKPASETLLLQPTRDDGKCQAYVGVQQRTCATFALLRDMPCNEDHIIARHFSIVRLPCWHYRWQKHDNYEREMVLLALPMAET